MWRRTLHYELLKYVKNKVIEVWRSVSEAVLGTGEPGEERV